MVGEKTERLGFMEVVVRRDDGAQGGEGLEERNQDSEAGDLASIASARPDGLEGMPFAWPPPPHETGPTRFLGRGSHPKPGTVIYPPALHSSNLVI